jgi:hypothetical protein
MIDKHNKFEIPVSDWAHVKEKAPSVQGYQTERNLIKFFKAKINSRAVLDEMRSLAVPSMSKRILKSFSPSDFVETVEYALHKVKPETAIRIWERLSDGMSRTELIEKKDEVNTEDLVRELAAIFKASHKRDDEEV